MRVRPALLCAAILSITACGGDTPPPAPVATAPPSTAATPPAAEVAAPGESTASLLSRANAAFAANRLVAPAGDNALELFLAVMRADPDNGPAREALVELFPFAVTASRRALADNQLDEAERIIELFGQANPNSMALNELRTTLAARRGRVAATEAAAAAAAARAATPTTPRAESPTAPVASTTTLPPTRDVEPATPTPGSPPPAASTAAASASTGSATPPTRTPLATPEPTTVGTTPPAPTATEAKPDVIASAYVEPVAIERAPPDYPAYARQRRMKGWVDLEFTVRADGGVSDVRIVAAEPRRVFDNAAQRAVSKWRFKPATRNGKAEPARTRTRIQFQP